MIALLVASLIQQESNFAKLFPKPTGLNGYEDYVRAGDLVGPMSDFRDYENLIRRPGLVPSPTAAAQAIGPDFYTAQVREVEAFPDVTALVISGNQKSIQLPQELGPNALFPELGTFRMVSRYQVHRAYVEFASGRGDQGLDTLLTTFEFSRSISQGLVISRLVGVACESTEFLEVNQHLQKLSLDQLERLDTYSQISLSANPSGVMALTGETQLLEKSIAKMDSNDKEAANLFDSEKMAGVWKSMSLSDRNEVKNRAASINREFNSQTANILCGPEANWLPYYKTLLGDPEPTAVEIFADAFGTKNNDCALIRAEAIKRIQFHLLHLHCKVLEYRWTHGVLPKGLADCVPSEEATDLISGKPFTYVRRGKGYTLTSEGTDEIGKVALDLLKASAVNSDQGTAVP